MILFLSISTRKVEETKQFVRAWSMAAWIDLVVDGSLCVNCFEILRWTPLKKGVHVQVGASAPWDPAVLLSHQLFQGKYLQLSFSSKMRFWAFARKVESWQPYRREVALFLQKVLLWSGTVIISVVLNCLTSPLNLENRDNTLFFPFGSTV